MSSADHAASSDLRDRGIGVPELGELWKVPALQESLLIATAKRQDAWKTPDEMTLTMLVSAGGPAGRSLAEAFRAFPWRVRNWSVRALLENSAALERDGFSFRKWLRRECEQLGLNTPEFPPGDFRQAVELETSRYGRIMEIPMTLEEALRVRLERTFYMVGRALAAYMLCDWQLWLWQEGLTRVFATYKQDSRHEDFVRDYGKGVIPSEEKLFAEWWLSTAMYPELPRRIINECVWLGL
jgi:hypothetical protein